MKSTLLDTNVLIDYTRGRAAAVALLEGLPVAPSASVVTLMELLEGARSQRETTEIKLLQRTINFLTVSPEIAERAGEFLKHYRASHGIDTPDALIAATAEHHGLKLATLNVKHFPMFAKLKAPY